jgi:NAD(P)-dependent dehydrogenase (short-subunit alcohol dehydrogenase family)/predicted choloylglycine hydrolase
VTDRFAGKRCLVAGSGEGADAIAARLEAEGGRVVRLAGDLATDTGSRAAVMDASSRLGGPPDVCVTAFAVREDRPFLDLDDEVWERTIDENLKGAFMVGREAARAMVGAGGGVIVHVSSDVAARPGPATSAYAAAKAGVNLLTIVQALDLAPDGVRVCAVAAPDDGAEPPGSAALGADDLAGAVAFCASDEASYVLGSTFYLNGPPAHPRMTTPPVLDAAGTPRELGLAVGRQAGPLVRSAVDAIASFELPAEEVERRLAAIEARLQETWPHVLEEIAGLAEGAEVDTRRALALSVASDVDGRLPGWCSLVAVPGEDGLLVGKNLDAHRGSGPRQVVERMRPEGGLAFLHLTTAGALWTEGGVNEAGLALVNASLAASRPDAEGLPDGILARELLTRCEDVPEAIDFAGRFGMRTLGENVLVADADGRTAVLSMLPGGHAVAQGVAAAACNHVLEPDLEELMDARDPIRANSLRRYGHLAGAVRNGDRWTLEQVGALLGDDEAGICQHGDAGLYTEATIVAAPLERRLWVSAGPACRGSFTEHRIEET